MKLTKIILTAALICAGCLSAEAQNLKDILSGVLEKVTEESANEESEIVGTWAYDSPDCKFESDNLLAKAGASLASSKVNNKLKSVYSKVGMDSLKITFNADSTYTSTIKNKTITGTYSYDKKEKAVTMTPKIGKPYTMHTDLGGNSLSMTFESKKLMEGIKAITNLASKVNTTASLVNSLISSYDGMKLGFKMKKQ